MHVASKLLDNPKLFQKRHIISTKPIDFQNGHQWMIRISQINASRYSLYQEYITYAKDDCISGKYPFALYGFSGSTKPLSLAVFSLPNRSAAPSRKAPSISNIYIYMYIYLFIYIDREIIRECINVLVYIYIYMYKCTHV